MAKKHPSRALKLLSNEQLQRIIDRRGDIIVASMRLCPLAIATGSSIMSGQSFAYAINKFGQRSVEDAGYEFILWFDSAVGDTSDKRQTGRVVALAKSILKQRGVESV